MSRTESPNNALLRCKIEDLTFQYRAEMVRQNNLSSVVRSYAAADRIKSEIDKIQARLNSGGVVWISFVKV